MTSQSIAHTSPQRRFGRRRWITALVAAAAACTLAPATAAAQQGDGGDYVTTTTPSSRSIDVSAFSPACIRDAPYINFSIVPIGFVPDDNSATLRVFDVNGSLVETLTVNSLSGTFIYPGASVDAAGNATDWPGWKQAPDGSWTPDSDTILREGLTIEVTVNPTATASVSYPSAASDCAGPGSAASECVPGQNGDANPADDCTPCVPGQGSGSDGTELNCAGTLPRTGGNGLAGPLSVGTISLVAGLAAVAATRRRRNVADATG